MEHRFTIPGVTLSQNVYDRIHWSKRHDLRDQWFTEVRVCCGIGPRIDAIARLTLTRVSNRLIDPTNVPSATKPLIDGLVHFGWLRGDTANDVVPTFDQRKCEKGEAPHMEIKIRYEQ